MILVWPTNTEQWVNVVLVVSCQFFAKVSIFNAFIQWGFWAAPKNISNMISSNECVWFSCRVFGSVTVSVTGVTGRVSAPRVRIWSRLVFPFSRWEKARRPQRQWQMIINSYKLSAPTVTACTVASGPVRLLHVCNAVKSTGRRNMKDYCGVTPCLWRHSPGLLKGNPNLATVYEENLIECKITRWFRKCFSIFTMILLSWQWLANLFRTVLYSTALYRTWFQIIQAYFFIRKRRNRSWKHFTWREVRERLDSSIWIPFGVRAYLCCVLRFYLQWAAFAPTILPLLTQLPLYVLPACCVLPVA